MNLHRVMKHFWLLTFMAASLPAAEPAVSFRSDVMPVFFRAGCNSGGCHGAASGKDGFRLSLFGYDAAGDYFRLAQQIVGRRVDVAAPEQSLLLLKAINAVPHTGGKLLEKDSPHYRTLLRWIQQGAPDDDQAVPLVTGIALQPAALLFDKSRASQPLRVVARYSNGQSREVTSLALFSSNNKTVAAIGDDGVVKPGSRGATDVFARFDRFTVGAEVVVLPERDNFQWPASAVAFNALDEPVLRRLQQLRILPSDLCDDATFLRRVTFDLIGLPPTEEEYRRFMADKSADRRARLVDALLKRPEYAELWAAKWAGWLKLLGDTNSGSGTDHKAALAYFEWLTRQFAGNTPLNRFAQAQIAARGSNFIQPESNFYTMLPAGNYSAKAVAQDVAQLFTGMRIQCAECHNHPFDRWTQDDYYGFVSFFTGVKRKVASKPREFYIYNDNSAPPAAHMLDERPVPARFLGGDAPDTKGRDPRAALAAWLTAPENTLFTRNLANRIWAHFFGRGIVEPLDDFRITNPPSNGPLLDTLARRLVEHRFDQKALIRDIVTSRTYQLSAATNETNRGDDRQFSHAAVRRLPAAMALDAIATATGFETRFKSLPPGHRAMQVYESGRKQGSYFLTAFGESERKSVCADDEVTAPSFAQTLHLINGDTVLKKLQASTVVASALKSGRKPEEIVTNLFIRTLGREPGAKERSAFRDIIGGSPVEADYKDLWWALLNSTEFLFQH